MSMKAEKEIISMMHSIDKVVVRMDQKLTDHINDNKERDEIMNRRITATNDRVEENTKFRNKLIGMGKIGTVLAVIGGVIITVIQVLNGRKN